MGGERADSKDPSSRILAHIIICLLNSSHPHMLYWKDKKEKIFEIKLVNKKSSKWKEEDISLLKELDQLFGERYTGEKNYAECSRRRAQSNLNNLCERGLLKKICQDKTIKSIRISRYKITEKGLKIKELNNPSSSEKHGLQENEQLAETQPEDTVSTANQESTPKCSFVPISLKVIIVENPCLPFLFVNEPASMNLQMNGISTSSISTGLDSGLEANESMQTMYGNGLTNTTMYGNGLTNTTMYGNGLTNTTMYGNGLTNTIMYGNGLTQSNTYGNELLSTCNQGSSFGNVCSQAESESDHHEMQPEELLNNLNNSTPGGLQFTANTWDDIYHEIPSAEGQGKKGNVYNETHQVIGNPVISPSSSEAENDLYYYLQSDYHSSSMPNGKTEIFSASPQSDNQTENLRPLLDDPHMFAVSSPSETLSVADGEMENFSASPLGDLSMEIFSEISLPDSPKWDDFCDLLEIMEQENDDLS